MVIVAQCLRGYCIQNAPFHFSLIPFNFNGCMSNSSREPGFRGIKRLATLRGSVQYRFIGYAAAESCAAFSVIRY